jgi:hypothetical protein
VGLLVVCLRDVEWGKISRPTFCYVELLSCLRFAVVVLLLFSDACLPTLANACRLAAIGRRVGDRVLELLCFRQKSPKREIKLQDILLFVHTVVWKVGCACCPPNSEMVVTCHLQLNTPSTHTPLNTPSTHTPPNTPSTHTPLNTPSTHTPLNTPSTHTPLNTPSTHAKTRMRYSGNTSVSQKLRVLS